MNENGNTTVSTDPVELLADPDPAEEMAAAAEEVIETVGVTERPFMTTSFEEYTVVEGLLLVILLSLIVGWCLKLLRGGFSWLF